MPLLRSNVAHREFCLIFQLNIAPASPSSLADLFYVILATTNPTQGKDELKLVLNEFSLLMAANLAAEPFPLVANSCLPHDRLTLSHKVNNLIVI